MGDLTTPWGQVLDTGDFQGAFAMLDGSDDWFDDSRRGYCCSQLLDFPAAEHYFSRADQRSDPRGQEEHYLFHLSFWRELRRLAGEPPPTPRHDPDAVLERAADQLSVLYTLLEIDAADRIETGELLAASSILCAFLCSMTQLSHHGSAYFGLALCAIRAGNHGRARRLLEKASVVAQEQRGWLRARGAVKIATAYRFIGDHDNTTRWEAFARGCPCSETSIVLLFRRQRIILERAFTSGVLAYA